MKFKSKSYAFNFTMIMYFICYQACKISGKYLTNINMIGPFRKVTVTY